jgi:hypothetical protein
MEQYFHTLLLQPRTLYMKAIRDVNNFVWVHSGPKRRQGVKRMGVEETKGRL